MLDHLGIWAALPDRVERLAAGGAFDRSAAWSPDPDRMQGAYLVDRGVAVIEIDGVITKGGSWFGSSATDVREKLLAATADDEVSAIVVKIDSPGGSMRGINELAQAVAAANAAKPCFAFAEDLCASAAYFVASQAKKIIANRTAIVGSIGCYVAVVDMSAAAEQAGIKVHVVKSAAHKGAAVAGTPVSDETLAETQRLVDDAHDLFVRAVAAGRGLSLAKTRELADGRVHTAPEAKSLGLIDAVQDFDALLESLAVKTQKRHPNKLTGARAMSEHTPQTHEPDAPRPATLAELKAELTGADAAFLLAQLEANATLPQASKAYIAALGAQVRAEAEKAQAAATKVAELEKRPPSTRPGTDPLPATAAAESGDNAIAAWTALVDAELATMNDLGLAGKGRGKGGLSARQRAVVSAADKHPDAHAAYLKSYNAAFTKRYGPRYAMELSDAARIAVTN